MNYGLTSNGFVPKDLSAIKAEIIEAFQSNFGESLDVSDESVAGQIINNVSIKIEELWELLAAISSSFNPNSAEGVPLDGICDFVNITRLAATPSSAYVVLYGDIGTEIPEGHIVGMSDGTLFDLGAALTLTTDNVIDCQISVNNAIAIGDKYTITINAVAYSYTVVVGVTDATTVLTALKSLITNNKVIVSINTSEKTLRILSVDGATTFSLSVSNNLSINTIGVSAKYIAEETGAITIPVNSITEIVQPVSGLDSVTNLMAGTSGINRENDTELRIRRKQSLFVLGYATEDAVIARILQEVIGVTYCNVISNREDTVDSEGRPGHCGETIVIGGEDTAIAKKLWEVWPAGIEFYGNTSIEITDSTNNKQLIKFSRPVIVYIWAKIIITKSSEESFEASLDDIQNNIAKSENSVLEVGSDVPWQRIYKYIYGVKGVISATIVLGSSASPEVEATNYATANISIGSVQLAQFDAARIEVTAI